MREYPLRLRVGIVGSQCPIANHAHPDPASTWHCIKITSRYVSLARKQMDKDMQTHAL
jgi:hypothetical protein